MESHNPHRRRQVLQVLDLPVHHGVRLGRSKEIPAVVAPRGSLRKNGQARRGQAVCQVVNDEQDLLRGEGRGSKRGNAVCIMSSESR